MRGGCAGDERRPGRGRWEAGGDGNVFFCNIDAESLVVGGTFKMRAREKRRRVTSFLTHTIPL